MGASLYNHDTVDTNNTSFDSVSQTTGKTPGTVKTSLQDRAGAIARWLRDFGGTQSFGGTSTALTLTLVETSFTAYGTSANQIPSGARISAKAASASSGATTLVITSNGALTSKKVRRIGDVAIAAGDWITGQTLDLRYDSAADSAAGAWIHVNPAPGRVLGTTTNDSAVAGYVGEYVSSTVLSGSAVSLTTNTAADVTSISLTAGDWDVCGNVALAPVTNITTLNVVWISSTSATTPTIPNSGAYARLTSSIAAGSTGVLPTGTMRLSLSGTTTVYLGAFATFAGTCTAYGHIGARRVR